MKKQWITIIGSGALVMSLAAASMGLAGTGEGPRLQGTIPVADRAEAEFPGMAKVTLNRAMQNAASSVSGEVLKAGLEDEDGFLVYGIEVVKPDKTVMEVMVDAGSGKVLAMRADRADRHDHDADEHEHEGHDDHEREE